MRGRAARAARDLGGAVGADRDLEHAGAAGDDRLELGVGVEIQAHGDAEAVAQRRGEQPRARGGADQREAGELDLDRARRRPLADDEIELVVLHGGIEDLLDRRVEAVDLVDEEDVAVLQVGEQRGEIAGLGDDGARGGAEAHAQLARHDLGERGLAEAGGAREQHVVERVAARLGRLDEHLEVGARLLLADELAQVLRAQRRLRVVGRRRLRCAPVTRRDVVGHGLFCGRIRAGRQDGPAPRRGMMLRRLN